jgi:hypothetical protein
MFRHIALFRWTEGTTDAQVDAITTELRKLPEAIPEIAAYRCGPDVGLVDGNFAYGIVADFADEADWQVYHHDPTHLAVIADVIRPHLAERAAVQLEVDDSP